MRRSLVRTLTLPAFAFAGGLVAQLLTGPSADAAPQNESPYFAIGQLGRVVAQIENDYVDPVDRRRLLEGAAKGMVGELDPHSVYLPAEQYAIDNGELQGQFGGVGIEVDFRGEQITVIAPIEGTPAERAGILSGDKILAVDGQTPQALGLEKVVKKMRGAPGSHVKLTVRRDHVQEPITFDLVREVVHVASVAGKMLDQHVAYVRIKQFQEKTHEELLRVIAKLRQSGPIAGVLLDLRANPGGLVDQAADVADEFLTGGTIYTARHRGELVDDVSARSGGALSDVPVVVLVNEWSASASELVGGALQDNKRALVVGLRTFGKGSVQSVIDLPGGAGMRLTTARYYTPSGRSIQGEGLHPDVLVESSATGAGVPIVREGDLEGALPSEGVVKDAGAPTVVKVGADAGADEDTEARNVPTDPEKGKDVVLKIGFETLRDRLLGKGPIVK